ncbi:STAS domain-containing protein [Saccharothrix sp. NRRL B-16314]|uniref:STAS domain-containing protein n=1 Tax=Saccharothrix sp. NRRL B-16314 TaxID=1463825 RepID=UPI0006897C47|nr:STAS domain-containing protein [Saccharothrix sp. NRRL B-16314]
MTDLHPSDGDLAVETTEVRGLSVTRVTGDVDVVGVDLIRAELDAQLDLRPPALVADLSDVTVLGSLGIAALLETHHRAVAEGVPFTVVASRRSVVRPLRLTEVDRLLKVVPTLDDVATTRAG